MGEKTCVTSIHLRGCMREVNQRYISYPNRTYRRRINRLWCLFSVATSRFHYRGILLTGLAMTIDEPFKKGGGNR